MIRLLRTNSDDRDFVELVKRLDVDLAGRDGDAHPFYAQFNKIDKIKFVVVAYEDGAPVACGAIKEYSPEIMEAKRMYTSPESRGKGIAGKVLGELERWAAELSFKKCILETGKKQPEAIRLYQKSGYQIIPNYGQYAGVDNSVCFEKDMGMTSYSMSTTSPTPDPELNAVLQEFVTSVQEILIDNLVAVYLQGSFAVGNWDNDSDVDFTVVTDRDLSDVDLSVLQAMHVRIFKMKSTWAQHLEGSYFPKDLLKSNDPSKTNLWYLDNAHDQMILSDHDNTLVVRWVVREHGIPLLGPDPKALIDPVPADFLRQEVLATMLDWAEEIFAGKYKIDNRWAQSFAVLSYCRMLHTLHTGKIKSKLAGAQWAKNALDHRWVGLIQRAWEERPNPSLKVRQAAEPGEVDSTLEFIHYALGLSQASERISST